METPPKYLKVKYADHVLILRHHSTEILNYTYTIINNHVYPYIGGVYSIPVYNLSRDIATGVFVIVNEEEVMLEIL